jgi:hypothetical protein
MPIRNNERRSEATLWREFQQVRPQDPGSLGSWVPRFNSSYVTDSRHDAAFTAALGDTADRQESKGPGRLVEDDLDDPNSPAEATEMVRRNST